MPTLLPTGIITGRSNFAMRWDTTAANVLVIADCNLEFICYLVLVI